MAGSVSLCVPFQPSRTAAAFASDDAFASQVSELRIADPEHVSQYLFGMLAERGRRQAVLSRGPGQPHRIGDHLHRLRRRRAASLLRILRACTCGSAKTCSSVLIGPQPIFCASSSVDPFRRGLRLHHRRQRGGDMLAVGDADRVGGEARVGRAGAPGRVALQKRSKVGSLPTARMM